MAQTKKSSKDNQATPVQTQVAQETEQQPNDHAPLPGSDINSWLQEQILAKLGPISGQALIAASHAHGDRSLDWMAECLEVQGHADLAEAYRQRKREEAVAQ